MKPALLDSPQRIHTAWKALGYFNFYRFALSGFILLLIMIGHLPDPFGSILPNTFNFIVMLFLASSVIFTFLQRSRQLTITRQIFIQILLDIILLAIMMFASGGITSGIGLLLVISVTAGSLLLAGRTTFIFASFGSLIILLEEMLIWLYQNELEAHFTHAGFLGGTLFATAYLAHTLAGRIQESEELAAKRGVDLTYLARVNERIVQRMRTGILVLSKDRKVRMANESAAHLLGKPNNLTGELLADISPEIDEHLSVWQKNDQVTRLIRSSSRKTDLQVSLSQLGERTDSETLVFLEDAASMRQRAQQLKLASLGRLTASIAHEIRNPLGALSHASQLLSESPELPEEDKRLTHIIADNSQRVNKIIENILQLGQRDNAVPDNFPIKLWLEKFVREFLHQHQLPDNKLSFSVEPEDLQVRMDQSQLHQVLSNLCENALRYSDATPAIELFCGVRKANQRPYLDVLDHGSGIPEEQAEQIFEPFYTNQSAGTGLGLYIASELCEANQALLALHFNSELGCCFRITFAHPEKQLLTEE